MLTALLLLGAVLPSNKTAWMRPDSFHLVIGMPRAAAVKTLEEGGWKPKPGNDRNHLVVDYADDKSLTLQFGRDRLRAVNFELFALVPEAHVAFAQQKEALRERFGQPRKTAPSVVLYDDRLPNVMMVLSADPKSEHGRRGLGLVVVRYFDPRGTAFSVCRAHARHLRSSDRHMLSTPQLTAAPEIPRRLCGSG